MTPANPKSVPWYESAVIYVVDVKSYCDSNGDGWGDLRGLISRLDHVQDLGVDVLWLQPIYASPFQDNGYDVADYLRIDPRLGNDADFDALMDAARERGLRVILDLPLNHTSNQHAWFQQARADRHSEYRDYYLWRETLPENPSPYVVFGEKQNGRNWAFDEQAGQYYFHTFYPFQPDLNMANPAVARAQHEVARFWLRRGVSGFRLDAVPFLYEDTSSLEAIPDPHRFLRDLYRVVRAENPEAILLAEANKEPHELRPYFGENGDEMQLLLNFYQCNHLFLGMARGMAEPIQRGWNELPEIPRDGQWANFLRNHDELSLDRLSESERQEVFAAFAPDPYMQVYGRGIRRRLAPMLGGDVRRLKLAYSLLLSLQGTPVLTCGEEIGLGDDLSLPEREAARTPMQWSDAPGGGFSSAPRDQMVRPVVEEGPFGYRQLNVEAQRRDPESLLCFIREALAVYKRNPELGRGQASFFDSGHPGVLGHRVEDGNAVLVLHNLRGEPLEGQLEDAAGLRPLLSDGQSVWSGGTRVQLAPYGFYWFEKEAR
ncbi:maltose alpha-D-glucosyltransferase/alpha-amylase [Deinobacterium chartae]|uniref:Maltose alpha-D-glucosyltransferase/alpha-amylase n=1 Tax=Deinobacterium chartae TaxID=521158 RepID=A0A841I020_9DEIO|nr:alpha-amylase family protein [Deinobacterium chartae]MBB6098997.1 maltose alpha-D-glucosyltransferase/alpha-amylase [Deinobacterium chartae]